MKGLRAIKCWSGRGPEIIWQCQPMHDSEAVALSHPKKLFLRAQADPHAFGIAFCQDKPAVQSAPTTLLNLARKFFRTSFIADILREKVNGDLWICLRVGSEGKPWFVQLARSKPPELRFVDADGLVFLKQSHKLTQTKRRSLESGLPNFSVDCVSILEQLWQDFLMKEEQEQDSLTGQAIEPAEARSASSSGRSEVGPGAEQRELRKRMYRRLKTLKKSLLQVQAKLPTAEALLRSRKEAELLQRYAFRVTEGDHVLELDPVEAEQEQSLRIELDADQSIGAQINKRFQLLKKGTRSLELGRKHVARLQQQVQEVGAAVLSLSEQVLEPSELHAMALRYGLEAKQTKGSSGAAQRREPYMVFRTRQGVPIFVGRGPIDNDELTKTAKSNDYWLHAVGVTGSHVIIPAKQVGAELDPGLIRQAAVLAIHYSKFRNDLAGEVYLTQKRHLKKKRGMPAGLWSVEKSETLFVRYDSVELGAILDGLDRQFASGSPVLDNRRL